MKQMALWRFNGLDDGLNGRSVASLDFAPDFGMFQPTLAINGGGVYGPRFQEGFVAGPEIRFDIPRPRKFLRISYAAPPPAAPQPHRHHRLADLSTDLHH